MLRKILYSSILILSAFYFGCSENTPVTSSVHTVSGHVYDVLRQPFPNIKIFIGDKSTFTASDGSFSIDNVSTPYDLILTDSLNKNGNYYKNLSVTNLDLYNYTTSILSFSCGLIVNIPSEYSGKHGKIFFTNGDDMNSYYPIEGNKTNASINKHNYSSVRGKLIVLLYSIDNSGHIISYDNFGMKDSITLSVNGNYSVNFTQADLALNPGETNITGTISGGSTADFKIYFLNFGRKVTPNFATNDMFEQFTDNNFNLVLPTNLPINYSTFIFVNGNLDSMSSYYRRFRVPNSGSGILLNIESSPSLISPPNYALNVDSNTTFSFSGTMNGVYSIMIYDTLNHYSYNFYTTQTNFDLKWMRKIFNIDISNKAYRWFATLNLPSSNGLNDLVNAENTDGNKVQNGSNNRYFTTKP